MSGNDDISLAEQSGNTELCRIKIVEVTVVFPDLTCLQPGKIDNGIATDSNPY